MRGIFPFFLIRGRESVRSALFPHAESDYTSCMRRGDLFFALWCSPGQRSFRLGEITA